MAPAIPPADCPLLLAFLCSRVTIPQSNHPSIAPFPPKTPVLSRQQAINTIPGSYSGVSGPAPGEVVGIVLGSVAGFLFLLWLIYRCSNMPSPTTGTEASIVTTRSRTERSTTTTDRHRRRRRRSSRRAVVEIRSRSRLRPVVVEEVLRPVVDERRRTSVSRPEARYSDAENEVVVTEEHSQPRRQRSRSVRPGSGYRDVGEERYGGGENMREVRSSTSRRR